MIEKWSNYRMAALLFALPLIATAVASAQHLAAESAPLTSDVAANVAADLNELASARLHTISVNRSGEVEGRIASLNADGQQVQGLSDLKVFFVRDGEIAKSAKTLEDGTFVVQDLEEGIYSFVATGQTGFAAYGVRVVGFGEVDTVNVMEAAAVSPHFSVVKSILEKNLPAGVASEIASVARNEEAQQVVGSNRVMLKDGKLVGQVMPMLGDVSVVEGTKIHIIEDDKQVAQVEVDDRGSFMVTDLEPGVYDFVAAGPSGFAAVSFQAIDEEVGEIGDSVLTDSDEIPVAIPATAQDVIEADIPFDGGYADGGIVDSGYSDSLDVCLTCQQDTGFVSDQIEYAGTDYYEGDMVYDSSPIEYASESVGCGAAAGGACGSCGDFSGVSSCDSCGGGCCGGGGGIFGGRGLLGFGGGGGLGRLLSLGGLAGGIVALASDNDDVIVIQPASPSTTAGSTDG